MSGLLRKFQPYVTATAMVILLILVGAASCSQQTEDPPKPSVAEKLREAGLADHTQHPKLIIGVYANRPLLAFDDNGVRAGFDIEVARFIAKNLGYEENKIEWVDINTPADRINLLVRGDVDLVVASFSITSERRRHIRFAGPYFVDDQSVLIRADLEGSISTIEDLKSTEFKVCTATGSTSEALLKAREIPYVPLDATERCFAGVLDGTYDAMSSDRAILSGFRSGHQNEVTLLEVELATPDNPGIEKIGIGISKNNPALQDLVDYFLNKSYLDQRAGGTTAWQTAFNEHLGRIYGTATQPQPDNQPDLLDHDAKAPTQ
jgi:glutamate transport system substrate-binding protein